MFLYDVAMFLYNVATFLHDVLMLRMEGLDRFRGLPLYARFGQSDRTQKRHGTVRMDRVYKVIGTKQRRGGDGFR